ncbi:hypothetical protein FKM82_029726 [Ascaphus truei]
MHSCAPGSDGQAAHGDAERSAGSEHAARGNPVCATEEVWSQHHGVWGSGTGTGLHTVPHQLPAGAGPDPERPAGGGHGLGTGPPPDSSGHAAAQGEAVLST